MFLLILLSHWWTCKCPLVNGILTAAPEPGIMATWPSSYHRWFVSAVVGTEPESPGWDNALMTKQCLVLLSLVAVCKITLPFVQSIPPTAYRTPTVDFRGLVRALCMARRRSGSRWYFSASMISSWHSTSCLNSTLFSTWSARNYSSTTSHKMWWKIK